MALLLRAARRRAKGRGRRQQELFQQRARKKSRDTVAWLSVILGALFAVIINGLAALALHGAVAEGQRLEVEHTGKLVVHQGLLLALQNPEHAPEDVRDEAAHLLDRFYGFEASMRTQRLGGSRDDHERLLREFVASHPRDDLVDDEEAAPGVPALARTGPLPAMLGSLMLLWWVVLLVFQGEGLELDLQRRRHPMWEWLFSHPVRPAPVFLAEMLSPIAANSTYWGAPVFCGAAYAMVYGIELGVLAGVLIGIPAAVATACVGKALEIAVMLRCSPRSRGAVIGIMSWLGYVSTMVVFLGLWMLAPLLSQFAAYLRPLATAAPWPWLGWFLGLRPDGSSSFVAGVAVCELAAAGAIAGSVWFGVWAARRGLAGDVARADAVPAASPLTRASFGTDPLYRKELLWFARDRGAIVQAILVPLTLAGFQVMNFLHSAQGAWNYLCAIAVVFGTYFLWVLGPRSLASEGPALWVTQTWPRGLESLLRAKARLWSLIATAVVALILVYAMLRFPLDAWKIVLVGLGWFAFGRSMAEKAVTLVAVPSSSADQAEPIPRTRRWAASLGMLTFGVGIAMQQWHLAIMGIVYSWMTAAAMWQNFRARLPFLYDPWSETLPTPPTLMHAMIAISALVEGGAAATVILALTLGREHMGATLAIAYGLCATVVGIVMTAFLSGKGVAARAVWRWDSARTWSPAAGWATGVVGGAALAGFAIVYGSVLSRWPGVSEMIETSERAMEAIPNLKLSYVVMAIAFAPIAEEYLFRGLLFRALDREWGGWRAVAGSAAFFAVYHPPVAWVPVAIVGVANSLLFKRSGHLGPAVALHMVYNAVVCAYGL